MEVDIQLFEQVKREMQDRLSCLEPMPRKVGERPWKISPIWRPTIEEQLLEGPLSL